MSGRAQSSSLILLRWVVGLVLLWQSWRFASSAASAHELAHMGLPHWTPLILGGAEILAAILFLLPKVGRIGGYLLLAIFLLAILIHVLHGQFEVGPLLVYAAAVFACLAGNNP
jgi:uncharacterized membrane protein YphA (DoxX/SURF4 family)